MADIRTSQKISGLVLLTGIGAFFYFGSIMLAKHTAWIDFQTPAGVGEVFGLFASVIASIGGALGVNVVDMFRHMSGNVSERRNDPPVEEKKNE